jgi:hypothetical protein
LQRIIKSYVFYSYKRKSDIASSIKNRVRFVGFENISDMRGNAAEMGRTERTERREG